MLTLKQGYLRSPETGMHDLTIYSTDGSASTHFTLVSPAPVPKTGDRISLSLLLTLMTASAALGAVLLFQKKEKHQ